MACCEEHPVKAFSLTLAGAGKYVPIWCLPYILHFIDGDSWASRFNDIGSDNNYIKKFERELRSTLAVIFGSFPTMLCYSTDFLR
jgi:hypothetical protein